LGKRGNGEGTISRRKNGGWMAQYVVYTAEGRKRKTIYGKTRKEVAKKLAKALSDREGGLIFDAEGLKLREYLSRWLEDSVKDSVRNTTYERGTSRSQEPTSPPCWAMSSSRAYPRPTCVATIRRSFKP
jgi:integrase